MAKSEDEVVVRLRLADVRRFIEDTKAGERAVKDLDATVAKAGKTARIQAGPSGGLGALSGIMRGVVTWGARGTAALATAGVGVAAYAVKSAASLEQVTVAFTTMLHSASAAKTMVANLQTFAQTTPFELSGVEQTSERLLAFGFAAKSVVPMLTAIGNATSGLGTGQAGMDEIALVLGQMKALGRIQGNDLLQLAQHGVNGYGILEKGLGLTPAAFSKAMQAGKIQASKGIPILLKGMQAQFAGLMEKQSHTLGGIWSNFHDAAQQGLIKLANPFLPTMKRWLQGVTNYLGDSKDHAGHVQEGFASRAARFAPYLAGNITAGRSDFAAYNVGAVIGTHKFDPAIAKAVTVAHNLGVIVATVLVPAAKDLGKVLGPVVLVLEHLDTITGYVVDHSDAFHHGLVILIGTIGGYKLAVLGMNKGLAATEAVKGWIKFVKGGEAATNGQRLAFLAWKGASAVAKGALLAVKAVNMTAWWLAQKGALLLVKSAQIAVNVASRAWIELKFWGVIGRASAAWLLAKARLLAAKAAQLAVTAATKAWTIAQWLLNVAMDANPIGAVILVIGLLAIAFVIAYKKVKPFRDFINGLWGDMKGFWSWITNVWNGTKIEGPLGGALGSNGDRSGWQSALRSGLMSALTGVVPGVGGFAGVAGLFPHQADGGTTTSPGWSVVGERGPELKYMPRGASVIPLPRAREFAGGAGGDRVTVIQIEGREIARAVHRYQDDRMARR